MSSEVKVWIEETPNPETIKFKVKQILMKDGTREFATSESADDSKLAKKLFEVKGVKSLFIGYNFLTVTKESGSDWSTLKTELEKEIVGFLGEGGEVVSAPSAGDTQKSSDDSVTNKIVNILENDIRPKLAMDGGDVEFKSFNPGDGIVKVALQGACKGCPGAKYTLKMGIEARLKEEIPEVKEVEAV